MKRRKRRSRIIKKKQARPKKLRKVWLIKPFTKVKPSGKIYKRKRKKERTIYDNEEAQDWIA